MYKTGIFSGEQNDHNEPSGRENQGPKNRRRLPQALQERTAVVVNVVGVVGNVGDVDVVVGLATVEQRGDSAARILVPTTLSNVFLRP
jgi:hypothetical protein